MVILAVEDEPYALEAFKEALYQAEPDCKLYTAATSGAALNLVRLMPVEVAFLDIELGTVSGIELAKQIKDIRPEVSIVFVTGHQQYAVDAFRIRATGYLLKPAVAEDIQRELTFIYEQSSRRDQKQIRVQTFGGFAVFVNEKPIHFYRAKSKELLAYLVNKRGADITTPHACTVLWEEAPYNRERKNYFHTVLLDLRKSLREAGVEHILIRGRNRLAIDVTQIECDSYLFLSGDPQAINSYRHDYLSDYSWSEFMVGILEEGVLQK